MRRAVQRGIHGAVMIGQHQIEHAQFLYIKLEQHAHGFFLRERTVFIFCVWIDPQFGKHHSAVHLHRQHGVRQRHIYALIDQNRINERLEGLPKICITFAAQGGGRHL